MGFIYWLLEAAHTIKKLNFKNKFKFVCVTKNYYEPFKYVNRCLFLGEEVILCDYRYGIKGAGGSSFSLSILSRRFSTVTITRGYKHQRYRYYIRVFSDGCPRIKDKKDYCILAMSDLIRFKTK